MKKKLLIIALLSCAVQSVSVVFPMQSESKQEENLRDNVFGPVWDQVYDEGSNNVNKEKLEQILSTDLNNESEDTLLKLYKIELDKIEKKDRSEKLTKGCTEYKIVEAFVESLDWFLQQKLFDIKELYPDMKLSMNGQDPFSKLFKAIGELHKDFPICEQIEAKVLKVLVNNLDKRYFEKRESGNGTGFQRRSFKRKSTQNNKKYTEENTQPINMQIVLPKGTTLTTLVQNGANVNAYLGENYKQDLNKEKNSTVDSAQKSILKSLGEVTACSLTSLLALGCSFYLEGDLARVVTPEGLVITAVGSAGLYVLKNIGCSIWDCCFGRKAAQELK